MENCLDNFLTKEFKIAKREEIETMITQKRFKTQIINKRKESINLTSRKSQQEMLQPAKTFEWTIPGNLKRKLTLFSVWVGKFKRSFHNKKTHDPLDQKIPRRSHCLFQNKFLSCKMGAGVETKSIKKSNNSEPFSFPFLFLKMLKSV